MSSNPTNRTVSRTWNSAGRTILEVTHLWTVHKESLRWGRLRSEQFGPETDRGLRWCLSIEIPKVIDEEKPLTREQAVGWDELLSHPEDTSFADYLELPWELNVHVTKTGFKDAYYDIEMSVLTPQGDIAIAESSSGAFSYTNIFENFINKEKLDERFSGPSFTLRCDLTVTLDSPSEGNLQRSNLSTHLSEDLGRLLRSQMLSDVKFIIGDETLQAHKAILAARSRVFAAMFEHPMEERHSSVITITDLSVQVVDEMLRYVYTGQTPDPERVTGELMAAADKYDLAELKDICEETLATTVSVDTAAYLFVLADIHSAVSLKERARTFIGLNGRAIEQTPGWSAAVRDHPRVIAQVAKFFKD